MIRRAGGGAKEKHYKPQRRTGENRLRKGRVALFLPPFLSAVLPCASSLACPAHGSYRALWASRFSRHTNQGSQLHDGLVELPGAFAGLGNECAGEIPNVAGCGMREPGCGMRDAGCVGPEEYAPYRSEEHTSELQSQS